MSVHGIQPMPFQRVKRLDPADVGFAFPFAGFMSRNEAARRLWPIGPGEWNAAAELAGRIASRSYPRRRLADILVSVQRAVNPALKDDSPAILNAKKIADPRSVAVITGQQPGLFGGPMYSLLKTLTVLNVAKLAEKRLNRPVVPVFWNASEDHDIHEVDHTRVYRDGVPAILRLAIDGGGRALDDIRLTGDALDDVFARLAEMTQGAAYRDETIDMLKTHWTEGVTWGHAFSTMWSALFAKSGLVVVEPKDVRSVSVDVFTAHLEQYEAVHDGIVASVSELLAVGSPVLIEPERNRAPWIFTTGGKPRRRLTADVNVATLAADIRATPERFSSGVVLRTLVQDALFPTLYYCPGPGELAYWAQVRHIHELNGVPFPGMWPRTSATIIETKPERARRGLGIAVSDMFQPESGILDAARQSHGEPDWFRAMRDLKQEIAGRFDELRRMGIEHAAGDETLLERIARKYDYQLNRFMARVAFRRDEQLGIGIRRRRMILDAVRPAGALQERVIGLIYFLSHYGLEFLDGLAHHLDVESETHTVLWV